MYQLQFHYQQALHQVYFSQAAAAEDIYQHLSLDHEVSGLSLLFINPSPVAGPQACALG